MSDNPAVEVLEAIESLSPVIERYTRLVCPTCQSVCCIDRHSRYDDSDKIFLDSLGELPPERRDGMPETDPCQFLGERGCTMKRYQRPYRCTWYFCAPLLEAIEASGVREYRIFIEKLEEVTRKREALLSRV